MAKIENHKYSVQEAFGECFYIIPDYQREYVWKEKQIQQLLDDIDEQMDAGEHWEYFIGTVLVSPSTRKNHYEVIDGQQRLTTLFLVLCALRQRFHREPDYPLFTALLCTSYADSGGKLRTSLKLEPRYEYAGELMTRIVAFEGDPETTRVKIAASGIPSFGSLENLLNAYAIIYAYLECNYNSLTELRKYWGYLANNVVFIQISTDVNSALKIFETINERGVGLNPMDLLKNLLFTQVKQTEFGRLSDEWKKVAAPLEKAKEKPLRFLRYFIMANYKVKNNRGDAVIREDEIYDWFADKNNVAVCNYEADPFGFVRTLTRNVDRFIGFTEGRANDRLASVAMDSMQRLCGAAFSLHYVLLLAIGNYPKDLFEYFVQQLESFLFYYIFTKTPTKDLERNFSAWADELRDIGKVTDGAAQKLRLSAFIAEKFEKSMVSKDAELTDALKRYTLGSMQQYRTRYLLAKLTQFVDMAYKGLGAPGALRDYTVLEIEHILPNTPAEDLLTSFAATNPGRDYHEYKARLGNLTLLEKPINIVAGNSFFAEKLPKYADAGNYLTRSIGGLSEVGKNSSITRINQKLQSFDAWSASEIEKRQEMMIGLAKDVWGVSPLET